MYLYPIYPFWLEEAPQQLAFHIRWGLDGRRYLRVVHVVDIVDTTCLNDFNVELQTS